MQAAASIAVDASGAFSNLQVRIFPSFAMMGAPLVARWLTHRRPQRLWARRLLWSTAVATIGILALLSTFKATNEPLVSSKWVFYLPAEMEAIDWAERTRPGRALWLAYDERIGTALGIRNPDEAIGLRLDGFEVDPGTRDLLVSDVTRQRSLRLGLPLPVEGDSLVTYDNGLAQIYHLRPRTPFQR
jgi:hypothetical protein